MSRNLVCRLFASRPPLRVRELTQVVDLLVHTGFVYESEPGRGGQFWDDGRRDWRHAASLDAALRPSASSTNWALEMSRELASGGTVEVILSTERLMTNRGQSFVVIGLSTPMPGAATPTTLTEEFVAWSTFLAELVQPVYGWGGSDLGLFDRERDAVLPEDVAGVRQQPLEWLNIYGPPYIERLRFDVLRTSPAWRVEILAYPAVAVVLSPHPDITTEGSAGKVALHLGLKPRPDR